MGKAQRTREAILEHAMELATVSGLEGVTIGSLATDTGMSKSGLFAHFGSKERLKIETLQTAVVRFKELVISPALKEPAGLKRVQALFDRWVEWTTSCNKSGGCIFVAAAFELDDRDGPVRDFLVEKQYEWLELISDVAKRAVATGDFRADLDTEQFANDVYAVALGYHHASRLLRDPNSEQRARTAFNNLVSQARVTDK